MDDMDKHPWTGSHGQLKDNDSSIARRIAHAFTHIFFALFLSLCSPHWSEAEVWDQRIKALTGDPFFFFIFCHQL